MAVNRSKYRQTPRGRGRVPVAKQGDIQSVIDKIQSSEDAFLVEIANNLEFLYGRMLDLSAGKIKMSKDEVTTTKYLIEKAEQVLAEHYEYLDGDSSSEGFQALNEKKETVKESAQLISLVAKEA